MERWDVPGTTILEPFAGDGAIIRTLHLAGLLSKRRLYAMEIQSRLMARLQASCPPGSVVVHGDYFGESNRFPVVDCLLTNPPFRFAYPVLRHAWTRAGVVAMLLRLNFLESEDRAEWLELYPPDVFVLPNRPIFASDGTDNCAYGWLVWDTAAPIGRPGRVQVLRPTPLDERKAA